MLSLQERFFGFTFLAYLAIQLFGSAFFGMAMMPGDKMSTCPLMDGSAICHMNPLQHLGEWNTLFATIVPTALLLLILFLLPVLTQFVAALTLRPIQDLGPPRSYLTPRGFNALQEAFSNGILHPKLF